jgi:cytochrome c oxidase subunit 3
LIAPQNRTINKFQFFPFHLVDPSPWPILLSFSLLNLTIGAVAYMHGFTFGGYILILGFILTTYGMILWFKDVIIEGTA